MKHPLTSARTLNPRVVLAASAAMFALVLALKLTIRTPGFGFPLLYDIPVALLAIAFGLRAGLAAAAFAMVLYAIGDATGEIQSNVAGYISRAVTFFLLAGLLGLFSDRLRRADAAVRESEAHFRAALAGSPVVVWNQDRQLRYTWVHDPVPVLGGQAVVGSTDADLVDAEAATRLERVKREVLATGRGTRVEFELRENGEPHYFDLSVSPLRGAAGEVDGIAGTATDVTELKRAEEALRQSQALLNESQELARLGSWEWDVPADRVNWSDEMHRLFGTSPDEFDESYQAYLARIHPEDRGRVDEIVRGAFATGASFEFDHRVLRTDGEVLVLHAHGEVTLGGDGRAVRMTGTAQDVTAQRRAEEASLRLAAIVEQTDAAILANDTEGIITAWNASAERLYGFSADEALGSSISILIPRDHAGEEWMVQARILEGHPLERYETERLRRDGSRVEVSATVSPIRDGDGKIVGASSIAHDISARNRAQRELERSNAELEHFAYVASHDLSEPLRTVAGFVELLQRRYQGRLDDDADRFIGYAVDGVSRMQVLIDDLLTYSRAGMRELELEPVNCAALVARVLRSLDPLIRESEAEITVGSLPTVPADEGQLFQVFQNLISNAVKFNEGAARVEVSAEQSRGGWRFSVADDGIGIDPEQTDRIFKMFQRLHGRDEYGGSGIGLALCKRVVERHGGEISFGARDEGGTVFRFTLPDRRKATA
jgi:PAS domain S-box-containing protein